MSTCIVGADSQPSGPFGAEQSTPRNYSRKRPHGPAGGLLHLSWHHTDARLPHLFRLLIWISNIGAIILMHLESVMLYSASGKNSGALKAPFLLMDGLAIARTAVIVLSITDRVVTAMGGRPTGAARQSAH